MTQSSDDMSTEIAAANGDARSGSRTGTTNDGTRNTSPAPSFLQL